MPKQDSCYLIAIPDSTNWNVRATQQLNGETKNTDHRAQHITFKEIGSFWSSRTYFKISQII